VQRRAGAQAGPCRRPSARRLPSSTFSFEAGEILGSMCTAPHEIAAAAHQRFLETNLGDPGHFPAPRRWRRRCWRTCSAADPPRAPRPPRLGGTEANLLVLH